jgi:serine phosphatase RsbU (regulator of sigma subunit)
VFPTWIPFAIGLATVAAIVLAIATYLAVRGEPVREEDVRPLYAKNLAERMGLQAEVQAAREAQLRLMPQAAPQMAGLEFAACCLPAKGVGGDFYDFFQLDANRIGVFVAQGGEKGLASALCVALAKGVLMHASQQTHSAAQIVAQLEASMAKLLQGGSGTDISFVYGVIDSHKQVLNYARVGISPRVLVHRQNDGFANTAQLERLASFSGRPADAPPIHEGAAHLDPGDHLIFFTDGLTSLKIKRFRNRPNQWLELLIKELGRQDQPLQTLLAATLAKYQRHVSEDLTAVVLRTVASEAVAKAGVA